MTKTPMNTKLRKFDFRSNLVIPFKKNKKNPFKVK
jgi:hypothetical protein